MIVEIVILLSAKSQSDAGKALRAAAQVYSVDTAAIAQKIKQEFAAKEKAKASKAISSTKPQPKAAKKPVAA
jgi:ParB family chromosome partitioning protein